MFVHTRNCEYLRIGVEVEVFVPARVDSTYEIDGVPVRCTAAVTIAKAMMVEGFDAVFIHLLHHSIVGDLDGGVIYDSVLKIDLPCLFFIHGIEVQKVTKSRPEDIDKSKPRSVARALYRDLWAFPRMKHTIRRAIDASQRIRFVCVSQWMREDVERSIGFSIAQRSTIIPNGIDTRLFRFQDRWQDRHKMLAIRPLILRGKYAVDLAIDAMAALRDSSVDLTLYGKGSEKQLILDYVKKRNLSDRIVVKNAFVAHADLPGIHGQYGLYLAATRMDAQGVSMCEAMASGLPVISFNTCAIPEFINHNVTGYLVDDYDVSEIPPMVEELLSNRATFRRIAEGGRAAMEKIDIAITCEREITLASSLLAGPAE